jgi:hypothetical protein
MVQGTTQPFTITTPFLGKNIREITVTFWQQGNHGTIEQPMPIVKTLEHHDCTVLAERYEFGVELSPSETARFWTDRKAHMQALITATNGATVANDVYDITVEPMFKGGNASTPDSGIVVLDGENI